MRRHAINTRHSLAHRTATLVPTGSFSIRLNTAIILTSHIHSCVVVNGAGSVACDVCDDARERFEGLRWGLLYKVLLSIIYKPLFSDGLRHC